MPPRSMPRSRPSLSPPAVHGSPPEAGAASSTPKPPPLGSDGRACAWGGATDASSFSLLSAYALRTWKLFSRHWKLLMLIPGSASVTSGARVGTSFLDMSSSP